MIDANKLRKGVTFEEGNELYKVLDFNSHKMARGGATIRTKIVNMRSGSITEKTYGSSDKINDVRLEHHEVQYLYHDGDIYYFMNMETYEQPVLSKSALGDVIPYLSDDVLVKLSTHNGEPINIELPTSVDLEVIDSEPGVAGDTATGATKMVTVSTGLEVQTPLFVDIGNKIRVDTRTGAYITRA